MLDFLSKLFDTSDFPARWHCGNWTAGHGWLHVVSDVATFGAYTAIPIVLAFFVVRRRDVAFPRVFWLFAAFIAACGTVHLIEAVIFWHPLYRLSGLVKLFTAVVSWATVVALVRVAPKALSLPTLAAVNEKLSLEIQEGERKTAELVQNERNLKRYAAELERSNRDLDHFAYVASHDLRSPLRAIENLARWIEQDSGDRLPVESVQHLRKVRNRIQRMERLLDDLLSYSRVGRIHGAQEQVDTGDIVRGVVDLLALPPGFRVVVPDDMPRLETLRTPLETCLRNLIGNAAKHHHKGSGTIAISWKDDGDAHVFSVADDGPGIDPKYHQRIFEMFQTLRARDDVEGSGMGLTVVKRTAETYKGSISLESTPGRGATFRLRWPKRIEVEGLSVAA